MTNQVKLHVGYIGKTREGKRVEIVQFDGSEVPFKGDNTCWYNRDGTWCVEVSPLDIIGPWTEPKPEYETGVWYGWNGGDCPVHPETFVEVTKPELGRVATTADCFNWDEPLLFRIVTPYVEPEPKLECWALLDDDGDLLLCQTKEYAIASRKSWGGTIHRMIEADDQ